MRRFVIAAVASGAILVPLVPGTAVASPHRSCRVPGAVDLKVHGTGCRNAKHLVRKAVHDRACRVADEFGEKTHAHCVPIESFSCRVSLRNPPGWPRHEELGSHYVCANNSFSLRLNWYETV